MLVAELQLTVLVQLSSHLYLDVPSKRLALIGLAWAMLEPQLGNLMATLRQMDCGPEFVVGIPQ